MTTARALIMPPDEPGTFHCVSRCVRRAWLCGVDPYSKRSFEHRRQWVEDRLLALAEIFAVGIHSYAVMGTSQDRHNSEYSYTTTRQMPTRQREKCRQTASSPSGTLPP